MRITEPWDPLGTYFVKDTVDDLFAGGGRLMSLVERLAEKWLEEQGDDIEPAYDRNRTDSAHASRWWLNAIADEAPFGEVRDWLRSQASEGSEK